MKDELNYALDKFKDAYLKLREGTDQAKDELQKDGVIQRFEFTFELLWKTIKLFLKEKGLEAKTPKDALKEAFRIGWVKGEENFNQMLEDRNQTSHVYSQKKTKEIYERIKNQHVDAIEQVISELKKLLKESYK